jgi:hypothetical protein
MKNRISGIIAGLMLVCTAIFAANEITLQGYLQAIKGTRQVSRAPGSITINWTGTRYAGPVIYTAVSNYTPMAAVSFATNGIVWVRNVGLNSSVTFSFDQGVTDHMTIQTNEFFCWRLAPSFTLTNLMYKLTTNSTNYTGNDFEFTILEN